MSIFGSLATMGLEEVLQWISQSEKSGTLVLDRDGAERRLVFEGGALVGTIPYAGAVGANGDPKLLRDAVQRSAETAVAELLRWPSGEFRFLDGERPLDLPTGVSIEATRLLFLAAKRVDQRMARRTAKIETAQIDESRRSTQPIPISYETERNLRFGPMTAEDEVSLHQPSLQPKPLVESSELLTVPKEQLPSAWPTEIEPSRGYFVKRPSQRSFGVLALGLAALGLAVVTVFASSLARDESEGGTAERSRPLPRHGIAGQSVVPLGVIAPTNAAPLRSEEAVGTAVSTADAPGATASTAVGSERTPGTATRASSEGVSSDTPTPRAAARAVQRTGFRNGADGADDEPWRVLPAASFAAQPAASRDASSGSPAEPPLDLVRRSTSLEPHATTAELTAEYETGGASNANLSATPVLLENQVPRYPRQAPPSNERTIVDVQVYVGETGEVIRAALAQPEIGWGFDEAAVEAARATTWSPALDADGQPTATWVTVRYRFAPREPTPQSAAYDGP